jgi:hypothetical protein
MMMIHEIWGGHLAAEFSVDMGNPSLILYLGRFCKQLTIFLIVIVTNWWQVIYVTSLIQR